MLRGSGVNGPLRLGDTFYRFSPDLEDVAWDEIKAELQEGEDG